MTQRVVVGAAAVVFALLMVMVHLLVSMHDTTFPVTLQPSSRISIDFAQATVQGDAAMNALRSWDAEAGVGLVKVTADLNGNLRGKLFIPLNADHAFPATVRWYDDQAPARVVGPDALAHTTASGIYFVTRHPERLPGFIATLEHHGVRVTRDDATVWTALQGLYRMTSLSIAFVTGCVLLATLVLYWLAVKSRSRALRVLGGAQVIQIQLHDLGRLLLLVVGVWMGISAVAEIVIGLWKGWIYAPLFTTYLAILGGLMLAVVTVAALLMSAASIPSPALIARRRPATLGVRRAAGALKGVTFLLVLLTIGPTWLALNQAVTQAEQLSGWERLANQVATNFEVEVGPDGGEADLEQMAPAYGALVREAESTDLVALSYLFQDPPETPHPWVAPAVGPRWSSFALVNQRWLNLALTQHDRARLKQVSREQVPQRFFDNFAPQLDLMKRSSEPTDQLLAGFDYLTPAQGLVQLNTNGRLVYLDHVLIIVVPDVWATFNDRTLTSFGSSSSLLFTNLDKTQMLVESHGLAKQLRVRFAADAGILMAQYARYEAWLSTVSLVGLAVALMVAAGISAYLTELLQARNDFVRRLAGQAWLRILQRRVIVDVALGLTLAFVLAMLLPRDQLLPVLVTALVAVGISPAAHIMAAQRGFADVKARRQ